VSGGKSNSILAWKQASSSKEADWYLPCRSKLCSFKNFRKASHECSFPKKTPKNITILKHSSHERLLFTTLKYRFFKQQNIVLESLNLFRNVHQAKAITYYDVLLSSGKSTKTFGSTRVLLRAFELFVKL
jgi:hypothetical protein